jgi:D-glycero-D-manno-heptose 1,7-bisphosphate phosphatase
VSSVLVRPGSGVLLDRDGVLNAITADDQTTHGPTDLASLRLLPGVLEASRQLRAAGLVLVGVTNQPDIARGRTTAATVAAINEILRDTLALAEILTCPHDEADGCPCRKPAPGLLQTAIARYHLDPARTVMVGDRWSDVVAGQHAGCWTILVSPHPADPVRHREHCQPDALATDLLSAVPTILAWCGR